MPTASSNTCTRVASSTSPPMWHAEIPALYMTAFRLLWGTWSRKPTACRHSLFEPRCFTAPSCPVGRTLLPLRHQKTSNLALWCPTTVAFLHEVGPVPAASMSVGGVLIPASSVPGCRRRGLFQPHRQIGAGRPSRPRQRGQLLWTGTRTTTQGRTVRQPREASAPTCQRTTC